MEQPKDIDSSHQEGSEIDPGIVEEGAPVSKLRAQASWTGGPIQNMTQLAQAVRERNEIEKLFNDIVAPEGNLAVWFASDCLAGASPEDLGRLKEIIPKLGKELKSSHIDTNKRGKFIRRFINEELARVQAGTVSSTDSRLSDKMRLSGEAKVKGWKHKKIGHA